MKRIVFFILISGFLTTTTLTSCNKDAYCPAYGNVHVKPGKDGKLPTKKGKSSLFPKKIKKR